MSVPHVFKITRRSGKACVQYKMYSDGDKYLPEMPAAVEIPITPASLKSSSVLLTEPGKARDDYLLVNGREAWLKLKPDVNATYRL